MRKMSELQQSSQPYDETTDKPNITRSVSEEALAMPSFLDRLSDCIQFVHEWYLSVSFELAVSRHAAAQIRLLVSYSQLPFSHSPIHLYRQFSFQFASAFVEALFTILRVRFIHEIDHTSEFWSSITDVHETYERRREASLPASSILKN